MTDQEMIDQAKEKFPDPEQFAMCNDLVQMWINYTHEHPHLMLGTQLRAFGVCAGLAMRICDLAANEVEEASETMAGLARDVFQKAEDKVVAATLQ